MPTCTFDTGTITKQNTSGTRGKLVIACWLRCDLSYQKPEPKCQVQEQGHTKE